MEHEFVQVMNRIISNKEAFLIGEDKGAKFGCEDIYTRLAELQNALMNVVQNMGICFGS